MHRIRFDVEHIETSFKLLEPYFSGQLGLYYYFYQFISCPCVSPSITLILMLMLKVFDINTQHGGAKYNAALRVVLTETNFIFQSIS